jgi:hypothetical protein
LRCCVPSFHHRPLHVLEQIEDQQEKRRKRHCCPTPLPQQNAMPWLRVNTSEGKTPTADDQ